MVTLLVKHKPPRQESRGRRDEINDREMIKIWGKAKQRENNGLFVHDDQQKISISSERFVSFFFSLIYYGIYATLVDEMRRF